MSENQPDITLLLAGLRTGDPEAERCLVPLVYGELRRMAAQCMRRERNDHTLQATALVNEVYLKLADKRNVDWQSRIHFFAFASRLMREILVDHARSRSARKRGAGMPRVELSDSLAVCDDRREEIIAIDECLQMLRELDPRQARVVELRFFGGLSMEEIAEVLEISDRSVKRDWAMARAWMRAKLSGEL